MLLTDKVSFEQVLPPSLFYQDFNDTNLLVKEAACLVKENPGQLLDFSSSLLSETNKYLSLDRTSLQVADFETLFREHLKPLELRYEGVKATAKFKICSTHGTIKKNKNLVFSIVINY